jgi:hypothetical protein
MKGALIVLGTYAGCVASYFAFLIGGTILASSKVISHEHAMLGVLGLTALAFVAGVGVVVNGLGRVGASAGVKVGVTALFLGAAVATMVPFFVFTAVAFDK